MNFGWTFVACLFSCLAVAAERPQTQVGSRIPGEIRRDCSRVDRVGAISAARFSEACIVWTQRFNTIQITDAAGAVSELATYEPVYPWVDVHLLPGAISSQWLVTIHKSDVDRPDGKTFFVEVYALDARRKVFEAYSAGVQLENLDKDGSMELVLHEVLSPTKYDIQLGWPKVYVLADAITSVNLQNYPALIHEFIERAQARVSHLNFVCMEAPGPCAYVDDIGLLSAQLTLARAMLSRHDPPR